MVIGVCLHRRQPIHRITRSSPSNVPCGSPRINRPRTNHEQGSRDDRTTKYTNDTKSEWTKISCVLCFSWLVNPWEPRTSVYPSSPPVTDCVTLYESKLRPMTLPKSSYSPDAQPFRQIIARATSSIQIDRTAFESGERLASAGGELTLPFPASLFPLGCMLLFGTICGGYGRVLTRRLPPNCRRDQSV